MREDINNNSSAFVDDDSIYGVKTNPVPKPEKEIGIDTLHKFIDDLYYAGESSHVDISKIDSFSQVSQNRETVYQLLDTMSEDPTISAVLEVYAEDATEMNDEGRIVWVQSDDIETSKYITYLLDTMMVDKHIYKWTYSLCKYGDLYLRLYRESEIEDNLFADKAKEKQQSLNEDIITAVKEEINNYKLLHGGKLPTQDEIKQLTEDIKLKVFSKNDKYVHYIEMIPNPAEMFELTKFGKSYAYIKAPSLTNNSQKKDNLLNSYYLYSFHKKDVEVYEPTMFVHAALEDNSSRHPEEVELFMTENDENGVTYTVRKGQSLLYNSFKIWRQMMLLENALLLNRITKSSILRVIGVEVGDMPKENVGPHLMGIKSLIEQKSAIDSGNSMEEYTNPGPMENNIYVPIRDGMGAITTQQIGGDVDVKGLADIDFFNNRLWGSLRVPKQFMGFCDDNTGFNGGTSLSLISSRYAKMVKRIQSTVIQALTDCVNLMLIDKGLDKYVNKFELHMVPPTTQEEIDRRDNMANKVGITRDIMDLVQDIEDPQARLAILKSLLSGIINDPDVLDIIQDEIDKLEEEPALQDDVINDDEDIDFGGGMSHSSLGGNIPLSDLGDNGVESTGEEESADDQVLPTPDELDVGDFSDNTNDNL